MVNTTLEAVLRRDRVIVAAALIALTALTWSYLIWLAADMEMGGMDMSEFRMIPSGFGLMMPAGAPWPPVEFAYVFTMWAVMMIGMMTPSATPMILIYARVGRQAASQQQPFAATSWFASGYLLNWFGFAIAATVAQWGIERLGWLTTDMTLSNDIIGGVVLIAVGLYQWTPLKDVCLRQCQAPLQFIQRHGGFRADVSGSFALGFRHGGYCIGCCWVLMALLFVGGVMNVLWIAVITIFVLLEKLVPAGRVISRITGAGFLAAGAWLIVRAL